MRCASTNRSCLRGGRRGRSGEDARGWTTAIRAEAASALREAEASQKAIAPLVARWPELDVEDAYAIQRENIEHRVQAGAAIRGHKVGLSSRAMQEMMGVREPDYGHLLDDMFVFEGHDVAMREMMQPRVEIEVAFVLGAPLPVQGMQCGGRDPRHRVHPAGDRDHRQPHRRLEDRNRRHDRRQRIVREARPRRQPDAHRRRRHPRRSAPRCSSTARSSRRARRPPCSATR